jgi:hypothetical protein
MLDQIIIAVCGISSCYCTAKRKTLAACIWGLCAEPAWIYHSVNTQAWGIFTLAIVYSLLWGYGIYEHTKKS